MKGWRKVLGVFQPSWWLRRKLRRLTDKRAGQFYEGPKPPPRLAEEIVLFGLAYPDATPRQWRDYVGRAVASAYRDGYVRGYEWAERNWSVDTKTHEFLTDSAAHDFSLAGNHPRFDDILAMGHDPSDPLAGMTPEARLAFRERMRAIQASPYRATIRYQEDDDL